MQAVILAAGRGKRLHPLTPTRTKAMIPVLGVPIVERVMEPLLANGITDFILVVSPEDEEIRRYFREETQLAADVRLVPQPQPLGMGHALHQAAPFIEEDFLLSACDNLVPEADVTKLLQRWGESPRPNALLTLLRVKPEDIPRVGIVELEGNRVTKIVEKPSLAEAPSNIASTPLYCFSHRLLTYLPKIPLSPRGEYELQNAVQMLIAEEGQVYGVELESRLDLTKPADLPEITKHYAFAEEVMG
ncbi:MAG: UTP--glucose-1-phosphate uridylyltransferase [Chloroflexi bacterium]|nr:UTP--glucose-1-phosphate uridylyltransferase [Chloroflexota bacterium]